MLLEVVAKQGNIFYKKDVVSQWELEVTSVDMERMGRVWGEGIHDSTAKEEFEKLTATLAETVGPLQIIHFASTHHLDVMEDEAGSAVRLTGNLSRYWNWQQNGQITPEGCDHLCIGVQINSSDRLATLVNKDDRTLGLKTR